MDRVEQLLERAESYRRLALLIDDLRAQKALIDLATEYDGKAAGLATSQRPILDLD